MEATYAEPDPKKTLGELFGRLVGRVGHARALVAHDHPSIYAHVLPRMAEEAGSA